jgi:NAD(P)-dependent dehydrogenase (short-subunit alcohol dehydrogenase family)
MPSVVVTGASTGIGRATVRVLAARGFHVFGSVRRDEDARSLVEEFGDGVSPLVFDVTDEPAVRRAAAEVGARLGDAVLAGLVNNAGIAVAGPLMHIAPDDLRRQFEVNTIAPIVVAQAFLPLLGARNPPPDRPGRIVNISSVSGRTAFPFVGPYSGSKFALEGLSEALRRELMLYGIDVIVVGPGTIATPIWDKARELDAGLFGQTDYLPALRVTREVLIDQGPHGLPADAVGEIVHRALTDPRPKVRYGIAPNPVQILLGRLLPKRLLDRIIARQLGLRKLGTGLK